MAARWSGKCKESPVLATALSPTLLLQPSCTQGQGSAVPFAAWGMVALDMSCVQTYPCLGPGGTDFWRVPMKWIRRVQVGHQAQQAANSL